MNFSDIFIIYLSCGAPFGVYFYFQRRKKLTSAEVWLKSFLTVLVWIPYAFLILNDFATKRNNKKLFDQITDLDAQINEIQKKLLRIQLDSKNRIPSFEFREIIERYSGLTLACQTKQKTPSEPEKEVFRVSLHQNSNVAANCLHRRNLERLYFHQKLARKDFVDAVAFIQSPGFNFQEFIRQALELVKLINDTEGQKAIAEIFEKSLQSKPEFLVKDLEKEVWNSKELKQLPTSQISLPLTVLTVPATRSKSD